MILAALILTLSLSLQARNTLPGSIPQHMENAQKFLAAGNTEGAAREFQAVIAIDPNNVDARVDLGVLAYFHHDCGLAAPNLRKALSLRPTLSKARALLGLCERQEGHLDGAADDLQESLPHLRNSKLETLVTSNLVEIYYQKGDLNRAANLVADLQRQNPTNPDVLFMAYRIHIELAERARDALALTAPDSARMHELMAEHLVSDGDAASAITQYEKALAKDPKIPGIHYELGEAILQNSTSTDSLARAEREFEEALKENPKNAGAIAKLGRIATLRDNITQAQRQYQRALALQPDQVDALRGMGEIYDRRGHAEKAIECLLRASRDAPFDESIHYQLASLYRKLGRAHEASQELSAFEKIRAAKKQTSLAQQRAQPESQDHTRESKDQP